jgi:putative ABC transport system permease protein
LLVRIQPGNGKTVINQLSVIYNCLNPGFSSEYGFLDDRFKTLYLAEQRMSVLSRYFAGLAILISCLGLFGQSAYTAQIRQKEIAIRKVIGASTENIVMMLSGDFRQLTGIAELIAFPISWWAVSKWMDGFAYHTPIG